MMPSAIKNILPKQLKTNVEKPQPKTNTAIASRKDNYNSGKAGVLFGIGAGVSDAFITVTSAKNSTKKSINDYKKFSFAEKKSAIRGLHANGYNVRQFKEHIKDINELSIPKVMVKRALIYAGIIGLFGLGIDLIKNHNNKQANSKQS